ncbi:hypothetical protein IPA_00395 [Ignicoccus pacificus DSM 13166]|uniref:ABC transporter domain-containing protein n=1 Tax=Ignicoccus pacificus DSM 13166 TaxID=940294 RepID=A0A977PJQ6_9CREN|nr:hypothetical protein IPA_00395 [Ignicoccus pacificus DSM 13166]
MQAYRDETSFIPQELNLPPYATPRDIAHHISKINRCTTRHNYMLKFMQYVKILGVENLLDTRIVKLSSGEKERIAVSTVLARGCKLLLADEPGKHLDPLNLFRVIELIKHEADYALITLHNPLPLALCDRFYTLVEGVFRETTPKEALGLELYPEDNCLRTCLG